MRLLIFFLFGLLATSSFADQSRWLDRKAEGWFWYQDDIQPEEPEKKEPEPPVVQAISVPAIVPAPQGPPPLSSAWLRENLGKYLDAAVDDPSPENVAAYFYLQNYAMAKASQFTDVSQEVVLGDSTLDQINRRPLATFGTLAVDNATSETRRSVLTNISEVAGLFVFLDGSEVSTKQYQVIKAFNNVHGFDTVPILVQDNPAISQEPSARKDSGQANALGISSFPATVLVSVDGSTNTIATGPISLPELEERVLVGAKRIDLIEQSVLATTRPYNPDIVPQLNLKNSNDPNALVPVDPMDIVNAFHNGDDK